MQDESTTPVIYDFVNYREYLKEMLSQKREKRRGLSLRQISKKVGFGSPSHMRMILSGARNLTARFITAICGAVGISGDEAKYFEALVYFNQAETENEKELYAQNLARIQAVKFVPTLTPKQYKYLSSPYFVIIREMTHMEGFKEDSEWINQRLRFPLPAQKIRGAIQVLFELQMIKRDERGRTVPVKKQVVTDRETTALQVYRYHEAMLNFARHALISVDPNLREMGAVTLPVPQALIPKFKEMINSFLEQLMEMSDKSEAAHEQVYQINLSMFPLTKTPE